MTRTLNRTQARMTGVQDKRDDKLVDRLMRKLVDRRMRMRKRI